METIKVTGRRFKYVKNITDPLYKWDVRFAVRTNKELEINELLFDAPLFFELLKDINQIKKDTTDQGCIVLIAKAIADYFMLKISRIKNHDSFKKVIFTNLISFHLSRKMFFSYLVVGKGKFNDFRSQIDKTIPEDIYRKFEEGFYEENTNDVYLSKYQKLFNKYDDNNPLDAFYELSFLQFFVNAYCVYVFSFMDPDTMPGTLTEDEKEYFMEMLMKVFNMEFDKANSFFEKEYYPHCLQELKKIQ